MDMRRCIVEGKDGKSLKPGRSERVRVKHKEKDYF